MSLTLLFKVTAVQTYVAKKAVGILNNSFNQNIQLEGLSYTFPRQVTLNKLLILGLNNTDTCIYANTLSVDILAISPSENVYLFGDVDGDSLRFRLNQFSEDSVSNFTWFIDNFTRGDTTSSGIETQLGFASVYFNELDFSYKLQSSPNKNYKHQVDFEDVHLHAQVSTSDISIIGDSINAFVQNISLKEKSGLSLGVKGDVIVSGKQISMSSGQLKQNADELNINNLQLAYSSWSSFSAFTEEVLIDVEFDDSSYNLFNINNWSEGSVAQAVPVDLNRAIFKGFVGNFIATDLDLSFADNGVFKGEVSIDGLPNFDNSFLSINPSKFGCTSYDIAKVVNAFEPSVELPQQLFTLGTIDLKGSFTGFKDDFVAYCNVQTDVGSVESDVKLFVEDSTLNYQGEIRSAGLDLGQLNDLDVLGKTAFEFELNGKGTSIETLDAKLVGDIKYLEAKDYKYQDITVNGRIKDKGFKGKINSKDAYANFNFEGLINFNKSIPTGDFVANIYNLDFNALKLISDDRLLSLSTTISIKGQGKNVNSFSGTADAFNTSVCYKNAETYLDHFIAQARFDETNKSSNFVKVDSEIITADVQGTFDFNEMHKIFLKAIAQVYPIFDQEEINIKNEQNYTFSADINSFELINEFISVPINPASDLRCTGYVNSSIDKLQMEVHSSYLQYDLQEVRGLDLFVNNYGSIFDFEVFADYLGLTPNVYLQNANIGVKGSDRSFQANIMWGAFNEKAGQLYFLGNVLGKSNVSLDILPGFINVGGDIWEIDQTAKVIVDSNKVYIKDLEINQNQQHISLQGIVGPEETDRLYFDLAEIKLAKLSDGLPENIQIGGKLSAKGNIAGVYDQIIILGDVSGDKMTLNGQDLGDLSLSAGWNQEHSALEFDGGFKLAGKKHIGTKGFLYPFDSVETLDLALNFNRFQLNVLDGVLTEEITNLAGQLSGEIAVKGNFAEPRLNGDLNFANTKFKIKYLNTQYVLTDKIVIREDYIGLNHVPLIDENGNVAYVTGTAFHENFSNWNFDVFVEMERFMALNTEKGMNADFYGSASATGTVNIEGYGENVNINVNAKTEKGTKIFIPLDAAKEVYAQEFVEFVNPNAEEEEKVREVRKGLTLDLELDVNNNAEVQLIFDETVGDIIKAKGFGNIRLTVDKLGDLSMYGKYTIEDGDYLFTLQNIINKKFNVAQGSSISWYGDPYAATLDINAQYRLRAPLYDIMLAPEERYRRREQVVLEMHLTEVLLQPDIEFKITVPSADDFIKGQIRSALSSENELNRQVFALLMLNRFLPPQNSVRSSSTGATAGSTGASTSAELLSNQLTNLASQISSDVAFGVNYRPGTQLTNRELAVNLSTQIFKERVTLSGSVGVSDNTTNNQSNLLGDVEIGYALTKDGRLVLKAFNKTVNSTFLNGNLSPYIQGVGVSYQEEFDSLGELYEHFLSIFKRKKKKRYTGSQLEDSQLEDLQDKPE